MTSRPPTGVSVASPPRGRIEVAIPTAPTHPAALETSTSDLALALLVATVVLVPIAVGTVVWSATGGGDDLNRRVTFQLFDLALALTGCARIAALFVQVGNPFRGLAATGRRSITSALALAVTVLGVVGVIALAVHPSPRGAELAARIGLGALAAHALIVAPTRWLARVQVAVVITASAQALLAIVQSANGGPLDLRWFEFDGPLYPFGSSYAGRGGLTHPYHLAVVLEIGIAAALLALRHTSRRLPWLVAIGACSAGLGVTYSRAAAVGIAAACIALVLPRRGAEDPSKRVFLFAAGAMLIGVAATGFTMGDGWYARTSTSTSISTADSGRLDRAREAIDLIEDQPTIGVGPGRYVIELAERGDGAPLPAHNIVLHVAAEAGVVAGAAIALIVLLLAARYFSASRETAAAFVLLVPYFLFDAYPYVFPVGMFITALWIGLLERARPR